MDGYQSGNTITFVWFDVSTNQEITFNAPSGIYIYRLKAGDFTASGKVVLMK